MLGSDPDQVTSRLEGDLLRPCECQVWVCRVEHPYQTLDELRCRALQPQIGRHVPDGHGGVRSLSAGRLPTHESAVAMSVHKSQGSEFDEVDLVLGDRSSPIMTRELFYTGVTRARTAIRVFASVEAIRAMMSRRIVRESGLPDRLWSD